MIADGRIHLTSASSELPRSVQSNAVGFYRIQYVYTNIEQKILIFWSAFAFLVVHSNLFIVLIFSILYTYLSLALLSRSRINSAVVLLIEQYFDPGCKCLKTLSFLAFKFTCVYPIAARRRILCFDYETSTEHL